MTIDIKLTSLEDAVNKYNSNIICDELNTYIINSYKATPSKNINITLNIKGFNNKDEQAKLITCIHNYYEIKFKQIKKITDQDAYFRFILIIIGIISILISEQLFALLSEIFLIAGWLIIGEALYDLLFNEIKRDKQYKAYNSLAKCKITFE